MNRIKILDASVAGRIAAGEVVTSPASVVKELVENAIDAASSAVTVETKDGGRAYIRVTDNGSGIHPEDVLLSVQKHATSKIYDFEDMKNIASLGFRGEALSSIAAVAHLAIKTRAAGETEGCILAETSLGFGVKPAGLPDGTTVTVENLFYNVPARYKFLKSAQAESAAITDLICRLILSRPDISFKYITNGSLQFQSPGTGSLMDAILSVYGKDIRFRLFKIDHEPGERTISGYISNPNYLFKSAKNQTILINGRYIRSKNITDTLSHAYGDRLLKGHYPFAVLNINLPFSDVDVNVHPSKTTVMIQNESGLLEDLAASVKQALTASSLPRFEWNEKKQSEVPEYKEIMQEQPNPDTTWEKIEYNNKPQPKMKLNESASAYFESFINHPHTQEKTEEQEQQKIEAVDELIDYTVLGQLFNTYILVQSGEAAYIIDQHAAHERMNYERLKESETLLPQKLLFPFALKLSMADHTLLLKNAEPLNSLGFELDDFGGTTIKITALPLKADQGDIGLLMEDVIDILKNTGTSDQTLFKDKIIRRACRTSVKGGDFLSVPEMAALVSELTTSKTVPVCPHGRPVAIVLTRDELEKGFKRKV